MREILARIKAAAWRYREHKEDRWRFTRHSPESLARPLPFMEPLYTVEQLQAAYAAGMERAAEICDHPEAIDADDCKVMIRYEASKESA